MTEVDMPVICRVERLYAQKAEVVVLAIGDHLDILRNPIKGSIRLQDARSFDIDKATMADHFQPGDIVRASTLAVGDAKSCFFSTIGHNFGVIMAKDPQGNELVPVDQSHMKNSDGVFFKRKVAKPCWLDQNSS